MASRPAPTKKAPAGKAAAKPPGAAKPAAPPPKAAPAPVVTLRAIFEQLGETHALPRKQALALLEGFVAAVTARLKQGERVRMGGLGTLEVKARLARTGRNPATGQAIQVKASRKVAFRVAKELKGAVL